MWKTASLQCMQPTRKYDEDNTSISFPLKRLLKNVDA
jgi:hypothetical protein